MGWFQKEGHLFLPGNLQWKLVNSLYATTHLGEKALQTSLKRSFRGTGFQMTIRQVVSFCPTYKLNNPKELKDTYWSSLSNDVGHTRERTGRWTSPRCQFLKGINTYFHDRYIHRMDWRLSHLDWEGWGGGKKQTKKQKLLHEIILKLGLSRSLQSGNRTSLTSKVTQWVSKALGITYYLHCAWRPQSSEKVERVNTAWQRLYSKIDRR